MDVVIVVFLFLIFCTLISINSSISDFKGVVEDYKKYIDRLEWIERHLRKLK